MMKKYVFDLDENVYDHANEILEQMDLSIDIALQIFFKKIIKEGYSNFLFQYGEKKPALQQTSTTENKSVFYESKITKTRAISLVKKSGYGVMECVSFSTKNKTTDKYWSNPPIINIEHDWSIILNDYIRKRLHYFMVPKNSIMIHELIVRRDRGLFDLQILYDDPTFTDTISGFMFAPFLKGTVNY